MDKIFFQAADLTNTKWRVLKISKQDHINLAKGMILRVWNVFKKIQNKKIFTYLINLVASASEKLRIWNQSKVNLFREF